MTTKHNGPWRPRKLNELGFVGRGKSRHRPRNAPELYGGPYPFVQTADIMASEFYITSYSKTYSDAGLAQSKLWEPNTLCMTIAGENTAETAILSFHACFPDSVVGFIADPTLADVRFVKYYLDHIKRQIRQVTRGATQDNLSLDKLLSFDIIAPNVDLQSKIASVLSAYDELIQNNTRRIAVLEAMAQSIYREWFVEFRFPGHEKIKLVDSQLGKIPEGWLVIPLSQLVETQYGYTESGKPESIGPKYLRGMDINKTSFIDWSQVPYCLISDQEYDKYKVRPGDIFVIRMADPGKVGIVEQEVNAVFASYLIRLTISDSRLTLYYLFHFLLSGAYQAYITGASTGTTRKSASAGVVVGADLLLPPLDCLHLFEEHVTAIRSMITSLVKRNVVLRSARDLLLPKMISGQLDVEEFDFETCEPLARTTS